MARSHTEWTKINGKVPYITINVKSAPSRAPKPRRVNHYGVGDFASSVLLFVGTKWGSREELMFE